MVLLRQLLWRHIRTGRRVAELQEAGMAGMAGEQVEGSEEAAALREGEESLVRHLETSRRRELEEVMEGQGRGVWRAVTIQGQELLQVPH